MTSLDELDKIDWAALQQAFGGAGEVPTRLRAVASPDAETRQEALAELHHAAPDVNAQWSSSVAARQGRSS